MLQKCLGPGGEQSRVGSVLAPWVAGCPIARVAGFQSVTVSLGGVQTKGMGTGLGLIPSTHWALAVGVQVSDPSS